MLRIALAMFMIGGTAVWAQSQDATASGSDKAVDRADAYYHYAMACLYAKDALRAGDRQAEYANKAADEYKAAVKADPQVPPISSAPKFLLPILPRPSRTPPKVDPPK
jgi:hypothetical protein